METKTVHMENSWNNQYLLDIPIIDEQHTGFFQLVDDLMVNNQIENQNSTQKSLEIITELEDYLKNHFRIEEDLMQDANYMDTEKHISQHMYFINKIEEYKIEYNFNSALLLDKLTDFMKRWFLAHILHTDIQYKDDVKHTFDIQN